jgi:hypothetical protein
MKITLHLVNDDPNGLREARIDQWSGRALCVPRRSLSEVVQKVPELRGPCLYFLVTPQPQSRKFRIYVGEADGFTSRIRTHEKRVGWQMVVVFYSSDESLTKTGIQYLESWCVNRLRQGGWCDLENGNAPALPSIPREDRSGLELFGRHVATLMPILGVDIFSSPPAEASENEEERDAVSPSTGPVERFFDTIVCPAWEEGFNRAFLGQRAWWAVRVAQQNLGKLKYIAMYQVAPVSAITHYGEIDRIEPFEEEIGKFKIFLRGDPVKLKAAIPLGKKRNLKPPASRYTTIEALRKAKTLDDLFG